MDDRQTQSAYVSISTFARIYGIDRGTVYKWLRAHMLETYKLGKVLRIRNLAPDQHHPHRGANV